MTGLQTIYLYNSFYKGKHVSLKCDAHTNLNGINGAGKTSILRLIPMFYGCEPNRLVDRAANKENFTDYYLPNNQSMIVFEYTRARGETCCAVMFRRSSDYGFSYRLVKGSALDTVFHPSLTPLYDDKADVDTIIHSLPELTGVKASNIINQINDYRAIIQNDLSGSSNRKVSANVRAMASEYSLVSNTKMQHIHSLTTVSLSNHQLISRLKKMIVDSMLSARTGISNPPVNDKTADLWNDLDSLNSFLVNESAISSALDSFAQLQNYRSELTQAWQRILKLKKLGETKAYSLRDEIANKNNKREEILNEYNNASSQVKQKRGECSGKIKATNEQINNLKSTKEDYEQNKRIMHWIEEYKRLTQTKIELDAAQKRLELHHVDSSQILENAKKQKEQISESSKQQQTTINRDIDGFNNQLSSISDDQLSEINALNATHQEQRKTKESENQAISETNTFNLADLNIKAGEALAQTNEEKTRIKNAQEQLSNLKSALTLAQKNQTTKDSERDTARRDNREAESNYKEGETKHKQAEQAAASLRKLLFPTDGTLLAFLRESGGEWEQTLGKVINPALLDRKDLHPQQVSASTESMYGFELNLELLPLPEQAENQAVLTERFDRATRETGETKDNLESLNVKWKTAQQAEKAKDSELQNIKLDVSRQSNLVGQSEHELTAIRASIETEIKNRHENYSKKITQLTEQINSAKRQTENVLADMESQRQHRQKEIMSIANAKRTEIQNQITQLKNKAAEIKRWELSEHGKIETDKINLLSEKGVDTQTLKIIEREIRALESRIEEVTEKESTVLAYKYWRDNEWTRLNALEKSLAVDVEAAKELDNDADKLQREHNEADSELAEKIAATIKQQSDLHRKEKQWSAAEAPALDAINSIPASIENATNEYYETTAIEQTVTLDLGDVITQHLTKITSEAETLLEGVSKVLRDTERTINRSPDSRIYTRWQHLRNARSSTSSSSKSDKARDMEAVLDLKQLMEHDIPETRSMFIENVKSTGLLVSNYYENLCDISNKVNRVSKELENELETSHDFESLSDIKLNLISKVEQFDYWPRLKSFINEWNQWKYSDKLPPHSLQQNLKELESMFRLARMDKNDVGTFVDLRISLVENNRLAQINSDADLKQSSSTGLTAIAVLIIFAALTRYLCPDENMKIVWPVDELGQIDTENTDKLFAMMAKRNITILSAQPATTMQADKRYKYCYILSKKDGVSLREIINPTNRPLRTALAKGLGLEPQARGAFNE